MFGSPKSRHNSAETITGIIVLLVTGFLLAYFYNEITSAGTSMSNCYTVKAIFSSADGLERGSVVKISGIKIGKVLDSKLGDNYQAVLELCINRDIPVPKDSTASIVREGFVSNKYVKIDPGSEDEALESGGVINDTQSSINIESLIGKFMIGSNK